MLFPIRHYDTPIQVVNLRFHLRSKTRRSTLNLVWLAFTAMLFTATGCGATPSTGASVSSTVPESAQPIGENSQGNIFFPKQVPVPDPQTYPAAEMYGTLVVVDRCLRVVDQQKGTNYLPIWRPEFTLNNDGDVLTIRNGIGQVLWRVGEEVHITGGEIAADTATWPPIPILPQQPPQCAGPYWLVSNIQFGRIQPLQ
jgi:hypothetical protein